MKILSFKPGHDGSIVFLNDGNLIFSLEAEKNSFRRYEYLTPNVVLDGMSYLEGIPDVLAIGGWSKLGISGKGAGYFGVGNTNIISSKSNFLGTEVYKFTSSHERSHLMCSYSRTTIVCTGRNKYLWK